MWSFWHDPKVIYRDGQERDIFSSFLTSKGVYPIISKRFIFKVKKTSFLAGETLHYIYNGVWMVQRLFKQFKEDSAHQIGCLFFFSFSKGGGGNFLGIFRKKVPDNFQNKQICIWEPIFNKCGELFGENYWGIPMLSAVWPSLLTGKTGSFVSPCKNQMLPMGLNQN